MIKETFFFVRYGPAVALRRKRMGMLAFMQDMYSRMDAGGYAGLRSVLAGGLAGDILEVGAGTGKMFKHYPAECRVTAIEPDDVFREAAESVSRDALAEIQVIPGKAEVLPFADNTFDAVCASLVLCSVESPERTLAEFKRVLRPKGCIRLLEHVRSEHWAAGPLMDMLNPVWNSINNVGCNLNRKTEDLVKEAGFQIVSTEPHKLYIKGAPAAFPLKIIMAQKEV